MAAAGNVIPPPPINDFKLRHWRSPPVPKPPFLRRTDPGVPAALNVRPISNSDLDLDLDFSNWNSGPRILDGYTSIRDLLMSSPRSCVASPTAVGCDIQIRNPLVKQAVYAYLQLTPSCAGYTSSIQNRRFRRFFAAICAAFRPLRRCFGIIGRLLCCLGAGDLL